MGDNDVRRPFITALTAALTLALVTIGAAAVPASAATVSPRTPTGLPSAVEPLAGYVRPVGCDPRIHPGTSALAQLLKTTYPSTSYGLNRVCDTHASEHTDGRAIDWMVSARTTDGQAKAKAVIDWLLATDKSGVPYANARRLGVMYLIWNNQIWGAYATDEGWRPYQNCAATPDKSLDSACHRNHIHISLSWEGAMKKTSFWTKKVAAPEFGPCRPKDQNWAGRYVLRSTPCVRYASVPAPVGSSAVMKDLVKYSGIGLVRGDKGPAVKAVQVALHVDPTGFFGDKTYAAVRAFKAKQTGVDQNGIVGAGTWRALMRANAPK